MSLADFYNKVNASGSELYNLAQGRIMREGVAHKELITRKEADKDMRDIAHMRLNKENVAGQMQAMKKDIYESQRAGYHPSIIAEKEKSLQRLEKQHLQIQGDIAKAQGRLSSASVIRYGGMHHL